VTDARIIAAYRRLGSAYAAAAKLGINASTVYNVLRAHGVAATGRRRFTEDEVRALVRAYQAGESVAQLAKRLSEDPPKVWRALSRAGVVFTPDRDGRRTPGATRRRWVRTRAGEIERIVQLRARGMRQQQIADTLGRSVAFVCRTLQKASR